MKRISFVLVIINLIAGACFGAHLYPEKYYQNEWCTKWQGKQEVILKDNTRIDCVTKNYVVEFDFAPKWAESIGQSLHYARLTKKKPAIVLILENNSDFKYYDRIKPLCEQYGIQLWYMKAPQYKIPQENKQTNYITCDDIIEFLMYYIKQFLLYLLNG